MCSECVHIVQSLMLFDVMPLESHDKKTTKDTELSPHFEKWKEKKYKKKPTIENAIHLSDHFLHFIHSKT